jgi:transcriptional regulator with XRE-family HTH domain
MENKSIVTLGQLLRATRKRLGKTLREVERETGISNGYLSQVESDAVRQPSPNHLHKLADAYGLDYSHLMTLAGYVPAAEFGAASNSGPHPGLAGIEELTKDDLKKVRAYIEDLRAARRGRAVGETSDRQRATKTIEGE